MTQKQRTSIGFIGAGNMAKAMIRGLIQSGFPANQILISAPNTQFLDNFTILSNNSALAKQVDVLIFAVKPDVLKSVILELKPLIQEKKPLMISIVAGISTDQIYHWLEDEKRVAPLIRAMPNTPALINQAITGVFTPTLLSATDLALSQQILSAIGSYIWLEKEAFLDIVTGLSGSGPAFIFYILEAMISQAIEMGLPEAIAKTLALKTCVGSANLALSSDKSLSLLTQQVTSKNGTTFAGLEQAKALKLAETLQSMIAASVNRAKEISTKTH